MGMLISFSPLPQTNEARLHNTTMAGGTSTRIHRNGDIYRIGLFARKSHRGWFLHISMNIWWLLPKRKKSICHWTWICVGPVHLFLLFFSITLQEEIKKLAGNETLAIRISNFVNLVLFVAKVYASMESRSLAVIASTLDSLLDLLSGFILWFTSYAMRKPNQYRYPIGKKRMQPVVCYMSKNQKFGLHQIPHWVE